MLFPMRRSVRPKHTIFAVALAAALGLSATASAEPAFAAGQPHRVATAGLPASGSWAHAASRTHRFRGTVTSANQAHRWFRMRTTSHRRLRIHTTNGTWWDDCDWGSMSYGHHVDVRAYHNHGMWFASSMHNWHDQGDWGDMWMP